MSVFISPQGNREVWKQKPEGYFTENEWKAEHPDKIYSVIGTNDYRFIPYPYNTMTENEAEMNAVPPDDTYISTSGGEWVESEELIKAKIENLRSSKLDELNEAFAEAAKQAHCMSSVGFEINADDTAYRNIDSLLFKTKENEKVLFRSYDNTFRDVTRADLEVMKLDVINNGESLYQTKWALEMQIQSAETIEALDAIEIIF